MQLFRWNRRSAQTPSKLLLYNVPDKKACSKRLRLIFPDNSSSCTWCKLHASANSGHCPLYSTAIRPSTYQRPDRLLNSWARGANKVIAVVGIEIIDRHVSIRLLLLGGLWLVCCLDPVLLLLVGATFRAIMHVQHTLLAAGGAERACTTVQRHLR